MDQIKELLERRISEIIPGKKELEKKLSSGQKIRLYQGFDPSAPNLHIGHLVGLLQLKAFQDSGHEVIFLIGDFTGMIGDPTDKSATRPKLSREQVLENAQTYKEQAGRILRFEGENAAQLKFNSEWLDKLNFADVLELSSNLTVQQLMERDMFQDRITANRPIHLHEFMYPMVQGYDSVAMEVDLEVGGNDQLFNMMVGRHLLKSLKNKEKFVLTTKLLTDKEGRKIGKTTGNAINLFGDPRDLYGQIMALPDETVINAFLLATTVPMDEMEAIEVLSKEDPMAAKKRLAYEIVSLCHGKENAQNSQSHFETTVQGDEIPENIPEVIILSDTMPAIQLLKNADLGESGSQIKRVLLQGGVELNGIKIKDVNQAIIPKNGDILKFGKRTYRKIIIK